MSVIANQTLDRRKRSIISGTSDIAIVGMACRLPNAGHYEEFWVNLAQGINSITEISGERWNPEVYYSDDRNAENASISKWCACLERFEYFDHQFFNISPREALTMDPHQRQMLEIAWQCTEDAGIALTRLQQSKTAVYMTAPNGDYGHRALSLENTIDSYTNLGNYASIISNRISYALGLTGGSTTIDAACASALVALHEGKKALLAGECDYVLVGSANLILHPGRYISYSKARMLSPDGQCKTFDESADGFVPGEGAGVVLLQRLEDAVRDRNHIHAVIKGSSVNHIGQQASITAPRVGVQADLIMSAYRDANISPETVGYVETHGSGTSLGDPIEVEALTKAFRSATDKKQFCQVGSVKTNVGHLESASGMAGLLKTILMLKHRKIPPTLNLTKKNPLIPFASSPFRPAEALCDWEPVHEDMPLRAGVSAFGFGGVSAHVILEEYSAISEPDTSLHTPLPFLLSAKHPSSLNLLLDKWKTFVHTDSFEGMSLRDICGTAMLSRSDMPCRIGFKVASKQELQEKLAGLSLTAEGANGGRFETWSLVLGDLSLNGYQDFGGIYEAYPLFRAYAERFKGVMSAEEWAGLMSDRWEEGHIKRNTYVVYDAFVRSLLHAGIRVDSLRFEGAGVWVSLGLSRMLSAGQILDCLGGKRSLNSLVLSRPSLSVHNPVSGAMIVPYKTKGSYLFHLLMGARMEWEDCVRYLQKARDLCAQFTFRKLLQEWDGPLARINQDAEGLLHAAYLKRPATRKPSKEQLLLMIIVISSIRRLNQKWELQDEELGGTEQFHELLDLVLDQALTKEMLVQLLGSKQRDLEAIAGKLNERLHFKDNAKPYTLMKKDNRHVPEIPAFGDWIKMIGTAETLPFERADKQGVVQIGQLSGYTHLHADVTVGTDRLESMLTDALYGLWNRGSRIHWSAFYPENTFRKAALPVYGFSGKPFLLPLAGPSPKPAQQTTTKGTMVSGTVNYRLSDSLIQDHVITGKHLIPAAAMIAFALAESKDDNNGKESILSNILILNPGIVENERAVRFRRIGEGRFELTADANVLCKGKYEAAESGPLTPLNMKSINDDAGIELDGLYPFLFQMGYQYGSSLQVVKKIIRNGQGYLIRLSESSPVEANPLSSELLDGIIQAVLGVEYAEGRLKQDGILYIPSAIQSVRVKGELRGACYVVIPPGGIQRKQGRLSARLTVYNADGEAVLALEHLQLQACPYSFLDKKTGAHPAGTRDKALISYRPVWKESVVQDNPFSGQRNKHAAIFADIGMDEALADRLQDGYERVYRVVRGTAFSVQGHIIAVNPSSEDDFASLTAYLASQTGLGALEHDMYYLWALDPEGLSGSGPDQLERIEDLHIRSVFHICKAAGTAITLRGVNLAVVVQDCFAVQAGDRSPGYMYGGLAGFARTVMQENAKLRVHVIDLPAHGFTHEEKARIIAAEQAGSGRDGAAAYRHNRRYAESLELMADAPDNGGEPWKDGCTYLIAGGLGGIGLQITERLCRSVEARVIVLGSSALDEGKAAKLDRLNRGRSAVEYVRCDIADREALYGRIEAIKSAYGPLHGVIHCGGINRDQLLRNKSWNTFKRVLAPKTAGTYLLNELTRYEPLDFFLVCSSIVSRIGNAGQADYAAANGFIDALADYRRRHDYPGRTVCMNWTLWNETGMGHNEQAVNAFLPRTGVIAGREGVNHLIRTMGGPGGSCVVVSDRNAFEGFLSRKGNAEVASSRPVVQGEGNGHPFERRLTALLSGLLGVQEDEVDGTTDLRELGLDSVSLNEFAEIINREWELDINSTLLFEYSTLREIGGYLSRTYGRSLPLPFAEHEAARAETAADLETEVPGNRSVEAGLASLLSALLGVPEEEVDAATDVREFGLDSVSLNEFAERIGGAFGIDMNAALLFEYSTLQEIGGYLRSEYGLSGPAPAVNPSSAPSSELAQSKFDDAEAKRPGFRDEDIAIIGISGRMPQADNVREFWDNLTRGVDAVTEIPSERWEWADFHGDPRKEANKSNNKWGGFLKDIRRFDTKFFNLSPREAELMDPQQRILLEEVWRLFEDAGYSPASVSGSRTGVFIGVGNSDYNQLVSESGINIDSYTATGTYFSIVANRISYVFDLHGPSTIVDTACSSSLVAVHQAVQSILRKECTMAVAGGINIICTPRPYLAFSHAGMLSPDGRCKTFDKEANGYVRAEGAGVALLKPLKAAVDDGDHIYGIIKGTAINHNGFTNSLTAPNPNAQADVIMQAFDQGGVDPGTVTYIETHGTGTSLGDPIEINGLKKAFSEPGGRTGRKLPSSFCGLGAVKTNVGHLEYSAGIIGLFKVLLSMKHAMIPGNLHLNELNPYIKLEDSPFYMIGANQPWEALRDGNGGAMPRRAGVSSFGFGGANAHVVLEEYIAEAKPSMADRTASGAPAIILLSAKNEERLKVQVRQLYDFIEQEKPGDGQLAGIAYTLQTGRDAMQERLAILAGNAEELKRHLRDILQERGTPPHVFAGNAKRYKDDISALTAEQGFERKLEQWLARRNDPELLSYWAKGLSVDWTRLYGTVRPAKVSLPSYPFAGDRHWLPQKARTQGAEERGASALLHPLLHRSGSLSPERPYRSSFTGTEFFLRDHVIGGQPVLPGVAYLEMARAAFADVGSPVPEGHAVRIGQMIWSRPFIADEGEREVRVALARETGGALSVSISSESADGNALTVHGQCTVGLIPVHEAPIINRTALEARCGKRKLPAGVCYALYEAMGIHYGPAHRGVQEISVGEDEALARLVLPEAASAAKDSFVLHPSLLDAALQATAGLLADEDGTVMNKPLVPFALEEVIVYGACNSPLWASVRRKSRNENGRSGKGEAYTFDIMLFDGTGRVRVSMLGYSARVLQNGPATEVLLLQPEWYEHQEREQAPPPPEYDEHCVFFAGLEHYSDLANGQTGLGTESTPVRYYFLNAAGAGPGERYANDAAELLTALQQLLGQGGSRKRLVQLVHSRQTEGRMHAGLAGMLRTAGKEHAGLFWQTLEIGGGEPPGEIRACLEESRRRSGNCAIRYRDGRLSVMEWKEAENDKAHPAGLPWKDNGVYLITGGAGGLGMIFAREIAARTKGATLILTGRGPLDARKTRMLQTLRDTACASVTADYRQTDISRKEAVTDLLEEISAVYGRLNGILHCAGVVHDSFLRNKTSGELKAVMAPKAEGLTHLDEGSSAMKLDWFVAFSSISGSLGNPGQADYAAANGYMDAYCAYRNELVANGKRYGRSLSINWPLWQEGGMRVDGPTRELLLHSLGIIPMRTDAGLQAFYQGLSGKADQMMVLEGNAAHVRAKLQMSAPPLPSSVRAEPSGEGTVRKEENKSKGTKVLRRVEAALSQLIAELMRVDLEELDVDAELREYGFDSISFTELSNEINRQFGLPLMPTVLFEYPTIRSLARHLLSEYADELAFIAEEGPVAEETIPAVAIAGSADREGTKPAATNTKKHVQEPVAVIGMAGALPMAEDLEAFWENLKQEKHCITEIPAGRWDWQMHYGDPAANGNKTRIKWGGFMDGVDEFDPQFFGISPREAEMMDPQQRLLMTYVWKAIEDAGYSAKSLSGSKTGIFIGTLDSGYGSLLSQANVELQGYSATGIVPSVGPNRMSYFLNVHGPSEPIETACSSSLVAIHRAVRALENGDCDSAVVGGVNTILTPERHISFNKAGMLCEDGRCKTFSEDANGYVRGEGAVMLVLKKLSDAEAAGDHIYGLIKGTAENHGGRASSLTAPNPRAQADVIVEACRRSGVDPRTITYIEAHGTGTKLGDPIEINGLKTAFAELNQLWEAGSGTPADSGPYCGLGSVKTNIGHLELAAGAAGVAKVLLQLKHRTLAKSLHCNEINPYIQLEGSPFYIVRETGEWKQLKDEQGNALPRRAGISSFGFGGVNAHVVIEEYVPPLPSASMAPGPRKAAVILSARDEAGLGKQVNLLLAGIRRGRFGGTDLADIAYTLQIGREAMQERLGIIAESAEELKASLERYLVSGAGESPGVYRGRLTHKGRQLSDALNDNEEEDQQKGLWIADKEYGKLLEYWAAGGEIDWSKLYSPNEGRRRISLPTYPFAKERYWVPEDGRRDGFDARKAGGSYTDVMHPLLHQNVSGFGRQAYRSRFTGEELFLKDHVIHGQRVLPGVAYMEMALQAIRSAAGLEDEGVRRIRIKGMDWQRPLLAEGLPLQVETGLNRDGNGEIRYGIYDPDRQSTVYSTGRAEIVPSGSDDTDRIDLERQRERCAGRIYSAEQCYAAFESMGFQYGEAHRGLETLYAGKRELLAKLRLPGSAAHGQAPYLLHPGVLDAAIQATVGFLMEEAEPKALVPFALEELSLAHDRPCPAWAVVRPAQGKAPGKGMKKLDIDLCDEYGQVCIRMKGLTVREWKASPADQSRSELMLWSPEWEERAAVAASGVNYDRHLVLVCGTGIPEASGLRSQMAGIAGQSEWLSLAADGRSGQANYSDYALQTLDALKRIMAASSAGRVLVQLLVGGVGASALHAGLGGLLKTAEQENPSVLAQTIRLEDVFLPDDIVDILAENARCPQDGEVRYVGRRRWVKRWKECPATGDLDTMPWRGRGVYLITGGTGGLGERLAEEIVNRVHSPTIVIAGRSRPGTAKERRWESMRRKGAVIVFKPADVTDRAVVKRLIHETKEQYGGLNGVIHAAGTHNDGYLLNKDNRAFSEVLAPKVEGLQNLDEATRETELDWMLLLSSVAGSLGNPGQGDYAAANAFMDEYAAYRNALADAGERSGRTLSVNWPLWREGGMQLSPEMETELKFRTGLVPIGTRDAMTALYRAFARSGGQVMVTAGDRAQVTALLELRSQLPLQPPISGMPEPADPEETVREELYRRACLDIMEGSMPEEEFYELLQERFA